MGKAKTRCGCGWTPEHEDGNGAGTAAEQLVSHLTEQVCPVGAEVWAAAWAAARKPAKEREPVWVEQKGAGGEVETVDRNLHSTAVVCECGETRWVAPGDLFHVTRCKPCQRAHVLRQRRDRAKDKRAERKENKARHQDAVAAVLA